MQRTVDVISVAKGKMTCLAKQTQEGRALRTILHRELRAGRKSKGSAWIKGWQATLDMKQAKDSLIAQCDILLIVSRDARL